MDERCLDDYLDVADQLYLQLQLLTSCFNISLVSVCMHSPLQISKIQMGVGESAV